MTALPITRLTLREALSRRLILAALVLSVIYLALVGLGFWFVQRQINDIDPTTDAIATTALTVLALYVVSFLSAFLAMFLSAGSVSGEVDSGQLHAVLARPISRRSWLLQRWLGLAALAVPYSVGMGAAVLAVAAVAVGYGSVDVATGLALLGLQTLVLLSLGVLVSTRLSTLAGGAVLFFLFGFAWLAGIVEFIGELIDNGAMQTIGVVVSLLVPSDALWKGASYFFASPAMNAVVAAQPESLPPFIGGAPAAAEFVAWSVVYVVAALALAVRGFARRDL
jgi:Cu-processing system permease protein